MYFKEALNRLKDKKIYKDCLIDIYPQLIFLIVTFAIFTPSSLFLGNINEFAVGYLDIVPILLFKTVEIATIVILLGIVIKILLPILFKIYSGLIFGVAAGFYIQGNFMNPDFGKLNGTEINWDEFKMYAIVSTAVWLVALVAAVIIKLNKSDICKNVIKWGSFFVSAMQMVTLVILLLTTRRTLDYYYAVTKDGEFSISPEENTIVFVIDTLDAVWAEEEINPFFADELKDFTYFDNVVGGGAPTAMGMPLMLTGYQYDTLDTKANYHVEAYEKGTLIDDLKKEGYAVKLYTLNEYLDGANQDNIDNTVTDQKYYISDKVKFTRDLYKMVKFYEFPEIFKKNYVIYGDDLAGYQKTKDDSVNQYELDDVAFYKDFKEQGISYDSENKAFVIYHFFGVHKPYRMNEACEAVPDGSVSRKTQATGAFNIISEYMDELKKSDMYDKCNIIITADHGGVDVYENPAVWIKLKDTKQDAMVLNDDPVTFKNLYATYGKITLSDSSDYGKTMFEMKDGPEVRYQVSSEELCRTRFPEVDFLKDRSYSVLKLEGKARSAKISVVTDKEEMKSIND